MHKHKFSIGLVGFCLLLIWGIQWQQDVASNDQPHHGTTPPDLTTEQAQQNFNLNPTGHNNQTPKTIPQQQAILLEITDRKFSNDPYIELLSLNGILRHCTKNEGVDDIATYYGIAYPVHDQMDKALQTRCDQHLEQYPELIKALKGQKWITLFKPQSELGRLLKTVNDRNTTDADRKALGKLVLLEAIREKNGVILTQIRSYANFNMKAYPFPIIELLQSHDNKYLYQIDQTALNLMACQFNQGILCGNSSVMMRLVCAKNPLACGLDYPSWFEQNTLPGMKNDVQKLIDFYTETVID